MKKLWVTLSAMVFFSCTDYQADWDSKWENSFTAEDDVDMPFVCKDGETTIISENDCVTGFVCSNNTWVISGTPQCQTATTQVCLEKSTTAMVVGNCIVNYICSNNSWVQNGEIQCVTETQTPRVCNEGETVSYTEGYCATTYECENNQWVLESQKCDNPVKSSSSVKNSAKSSSSAKTVSSSSVASGSDEPASVYPVLKTSTVSSINCSKAMYCPQDCRHTSETVRCGKVYTGLDDGSDTQGYLWTYTDYDSNGGSSSFYWPKGESGFGFEVNSRDNLGYLKGTARFGSGYEYPFARIGFHIKGENSPANIASWNGMCLIYTATQDFYITLKFDGGETKTGYDNYQAKIPAASSKTLVNASWDDFVQEGWGKAVSKSTALSSATIIEFSFKGNAGTSNSFEFYAIGKNGTCNK